ncbi:CDIF630_02480 family spore surface protein [Anaerophilus nitritogenes]|uniref:CDIF630_02480 family spore surface protein n=1 Tax=Anaerophilus nitritogenes TaxID=2498136 RepID=UPI00101D36F0|nr:DUF3787 domain-containing protein [Anaerophilus nitritogenes]
MSQNKYKEKNLSKPIENHKTAPLANIEDLKPESLVPIPNKIEVENAKDWVDINEK